MLDLTPLVPADAEAVFPILGDPATWEHDPAGVHRTLDRTRAWVTRAAELWDRDGLSYWLARAGGDVVGLGGVQRQSTGNWNLHYRLARAAWGHGYATELGRAAVEAAHRHDASAPVLAWIAPHNIGSLAVARRLELIELGPAVDPSDGEVRLAFADRPDVTLSID